MAHVPELASERGHSVFAGRANRCRLTPTFAARPPMPSFYLTTSRITLTTALFLTAVGCESREPRPDGAARRVVDEVPQVSAAVSFAMAQTMAGIKTAWSAVERAQRAGAVTMFGRAPVPGGAGVRRTGRFTAHEGAIQMAFGDATVPLLATTSFLPCGGTVRPPTAIDDERRLVEAQPVTWVLEGEGTQRLVVQFAADGVVVMARDDAAGCVREADATEQFMGTELPDAEALFAPLRVTYLDAEAAPVATVGSEEGPTASASAEALSWQLGEGELSVQRGAAPALRVNYPSDGFDAWTTRAGLVNGRWFRLIVDGEREISGDDALLGLRDTLVWAVGPAKIGEPVFSRRWISGEEGSEASDAHIAMTRRFDTGGGSVVLKATRREGDRPLMLGVGKCPELEGLTDAKWSETRVTWQLIVGSVSQKLGTATRWELATAGCLDEVRKVVGRGAKISSDRMSAPQVRYEVFSAD